MSERPSTNGNSQTMPDRALSAYDYAYIMAVGFPQTRESTVTVPNVAQGVTQYIVQTFRAPEAGDQVFITINGPEGLVRVYLPARVTEVIASQRDALTTKNRKAAARQAAKVRKARGLKPGFQMTAAERKAAKIEREVAKAERIEARRRKD